MRPMRGPFRPVDGIVALVTLVFVTPAVLGIAQAFNEADSRIQCAANLRQIGTAMLLYSNENRGAFPRTGYDIKSADKPTWGTPYEQQPNLRALPEAQANPFDVNNSKAAAAVNDVTAGLFLLLRTQKLDPRAMTCPGSGQTPFDYDGKNNTQLNWTNWPGKAALHDHLSYSMQNPYPTEHAIASGWKWNNTMSAEFACGADMNPGVAELTKVSATSLPIEQARGNSLNHLRGGQNVLY